MPEIVVAKPFTLTLGPDDVRSFRPGIHKDVPAEVADHWFTQAHLAVDGKMPEPAATAPLTHEERVAAKASVDAAETRAIDAEAEAKAARDERDGIRNGMEALTADNAALRSRVASLEAENTSSMKEIGDARARADAAEKRVADLTADLDKATKPAAPRPTPAPAK